MKDDYDFESDLDLSWYEVAGIGLIGLLVAPFLLIFWIWDKVSAKFKKA